MDVHSWIGLFNNWLEGGFSEASWWQILVYFVVMTQVTFLTVTVYLHRYGAHRAIDLHPMLIQFFRLWVFFNTGMVVREWVAVHRKHHALCETKDDPHSPQIYGIKKVLLEGVELYRECLLEPEMVERYTKDMPRDWLDRHLYDPKSKFGPTLMMTMNLVLFGPIGLTIWACQMLWIPFWAAGVINGVGHYWGYRNHECPDAAVNIVPWAFFIGGEELHNNHHTYPNSAKFSVKWWEFDIGWMYICIFRFFGLCTVRSTGPMVHRDSDDLSVDLDTARAVVNDRFRILTHFKNRVFQSVASEEYSRIDNPKDKAILKGAPKLLAREDSLKTKKDQELIEKIFFMSDKLQSVYRSQQELKRLWSERLNKEELLAAFVGWMERAEKSGIESLSQFSDDLKAYTLPRAVPSDEVR